MQVGTYDLSEDGPDGYTASDWVCTGATVTTADSVTLGLAQNATCTITNTAQPPHLTLVKTVTNDNGGTRPADRLDADGRPARSSDVTGSVGDPTVTDVPGHGRRLRPVGDGWTGRLHPRRLVLHRRLADRLHSHGRSR